MKADYTFSHSLIPLANSSLVDLLINFKAETEDVVDTRRSLNLCIVIDRSGSMAGTPLKHAIKAAQRLVDLLTPQDILSVVIYDDTIETILTPQPVNDREAIHTLLSKVKAGGCTDLHGGWLRGCDQVKVNQVQERVNRVLLLTDGQANSGITDAAKIIDAAHKRSENGIATTTLGFGSNFNEDLLIGMANSSGGNFYFIQSPDDATDVFRIELESLASTVAQNLVVSVTPESTVQISAVLNNYRSQAVNGKREIYLGDVYKVEDKLLGLELEIAAPNAAGRLNIANLSYKYDTVENGVIVGHKGDLSVSIEVGAGAEAESALLNQYVIEQAGRLRIAKAKDEAIELADKGDYKLASLRLRKTIDDLKIKSLHETFEVAEEIDHLEHYAHQIEQNRFDTVSRKEMRDQSYQARARNRSDLKLRGVAAGSAASLEKVESADQGVLLKCFREGGKLRVRVISEGYNQDFNVQFPRAIRQEGVTYLAEEVQLSADGAFYRASGKICRLVRPGEPDLAVSTGSAPRRTGKPKAATAVGSAADLETTTTVANGVLVQCVNDGKKLRARVVSDGYDPNYNMRFPRNIREEGTLYVVDEVIEGPGGGSYIACGKIKRLIQ
ncbi:MAG: VWA domain-containing protein [Acidobacteriota bacterium]